MKAICVIPGKPNSVNLRDVPKPGVTDIPNGPWCAGESPARWRGRNEPFGSVEEVGEDVTELKRGDYVIATVRRPGGSFYDKIATYDMTTDDTYYERGINLRHGYLT